MNRKFIRIAEIIEYVFTFLYFFTCALFYSVSNKLYWLFLALGLLSLCLGLYAESIHNRLEKNREFEKKDKITLLVIGCISIIAFPACVFNILALFTNKECKEKEVKEKPVKEEKPKKWYTKLSVIIGLSSLVGIMCFSVSGHLFETNGGKVIVKDYTLRKEDTDKYNRGQPLNGKEYTIDDPTVSVSYTMYKPKQASASNPLPVTFVLPGFTRTKATMSQYAIEFTKRGSVVFVVDPGSQGATSYGGYQYNVETGEYVLDANGKKIQNSYSVAYSGMGYVLQYVYNNIDQFDFIDRDRIGLVGHSAGGGDACKLTAELAGDNYSQSIVKALYISGYIKTSAANQFYNLRCNTALSYAKYDEGSFRYQDENQAYEVIALRFINEVNSKTAGANGKFDEFEHDKDYGDFEAGTYRILHHEDINHCFEMYDKISISNTIKFFRRSLKLDTNKDDSSHSWFGKELSNGLALISAFTLVICLLDVVVTFVPFMKSLKKESE